jgi:hypothetical protein
MVLNWGTSLIFSPEKIVFYNGGKIREYLEKLRKKAKNGD